MSTPVVIKNGGPFGGSRTAVVDEGNHLAVAQYEPKLHLDGMPSKFQFYAQHLGTTGPVAQAVADNNADMGVAGTGTEFFIASDPIFDLRIMHISIIIADQTIAHNTFGGVAALSTGWDLIIEEGGSQTFLINKAKTSGQVIAQAGFFQPYDAGATAWKLTKWTANEDAHTISIPVGQLVPGGVRIGRGTKDRIVAVVNDDISGLTEMYVRVMGYRHYN
jgi:hypothetical protein